MKPTKIASLVALSIASSAAFADQAAQLDTLVFSAGFTPISEESYARSYTIITEEQIEQSQEKTVTDILRQITGVHVTRAGGAGGKAEIRIRGSEANHVLVLVNGIEVANSSTEFNFSYLDIGNIQRIEVLRGPQSALYGAGATAGIINIITKSDNQPNSASISLETVSSGGESVSAQIQNSTDKSNINLGISHRSEDGWDTSNTSGGDKDGFRLQTIDLNGDTQLSENIVLNYVVRYTDRYTEYDDFDYNSASASDGDNYMEGYDLFSLLSADIDLFDGKILFTPKISVAKSHNHTWEPNAYYSDFHKKENTYKFAPQIAFSTGDNGEHNFVLAVENKRETYEWPGIKPLKERKSAGIALDYNTQVTPDLFVQAGARYDDNSAFDNAWAWSASSSLQLDELTVLRASAGQGQTNPEFFQQFGYNNTWTGNINLKPEKNTSWDIGISRELMDNGSQIELTYFNEQLENEISGAAGSVSNSSDTTKKQGIELNTDLTFSDSFSMGIAYTYLDATGEQLRRPMHAGNIDLTYTFLQNKASFGIDINHHGKTYQMDWNTYTKIEQKAYTTADLNGSYHINDTTKAYVSVKNITNKDYQEAMGYRAQPRTVYLGVKRSW